MANSTAIPRDDASKLALLRHINATLPGLASSLDISADQLARLDNATAWFSFAIDRQTVLKNAAETAVAFKAVVRDGPKTGGAAVHPVNLPTPPEGPVFEDVFGFLADLIAQIKRHFRYTDATGKALNIIPAKTPAADLNSLQPTLSFELLNGQPELDWAKNGTEAVEVEVDRGTGSFALLTINSHPGYLDTAPLPAPGIAAIWRYRAIYRQKDQRVGQWSQVLEVAVKG